MATIVTASIGTTGRDHATVAAWEAATQGDLVAADEIRIGQMFPDTDFDEEVVIAGSTVDATRYRQLEAAPGFSHGGIKGAGVTWKKTTASDNPTLDIQENFFRCFDIEWTDWKVLSAFGIIECVMINADDVRLGYHLFHSPNTTSTPKPFAITIPFGNNDYIIYNIFIQEMNAVGIGRGTGISFGGTTGSAFNITMRDTNAGNGTFSEGYTGGGANIILKNCVALNCHDPLNRDDFTSTWSASSDFNAGSDTSAPGATVIDNITSAEFVSASDIHKVVTSQLISAGVDPASVFNDDIEFRSRPQGVEWDMGGDEFPSAGPGARGIIVVGTS